MWQIALIYKTSRETFSITFQSNKSALKCQEYDLCGISDNNISIYLSFNTKQKAVSFIMMNLPEHISPMAVYHAFSNFGKVGLVYFGTHGFNDKIRNGKGHIIVFPRGGDPEILPRD